MLYTTVTTKEGAPVSRLHSLMAEWVQVQKDLGRKALAARDMPSLRAEVIALRRRFAENLQRLAAEIEIDPQLKADPGLSAEFRERFSQTRKRIAIFQAKWPAVLLDSSSPFFIEEGDVLNASNRDFSDWALRMIHH